MKDVNDELTIKQWLWVIIFYFVAFVYAVLCQGYVAFILWGWFAPDEIVGYIQNQWEIFYVLAFVKLMLIPNKSRKDFKNHIERIRESCYSIFLGPWGKLFIGWVVYNKFWIF